MSCNLDQGICAIAKQRVSIPIGFSNELQLQHAALGADPVDVSIPIGFSNELQPSSSTTCGPAVGCFNPYRVFQ